MRLLIILLMACVGALAQAPVEKLAGGFKFTEGPLWMREGGLLFTDIPNHVVNRWSPDGTVTAYMQSAERAGYNGLTLDKQGRLILCEQNGRRLVRRESDGRITVLAERFEGKRLNSPNDVVVAADGSIYFTDPPYGLPKGLNDPGRELAFCGVYRLRDGKLTLLTRELSAPNGLAFSPDGKALYVANSDPKRKIVMRYAVLQDGTLSNGRVFADVTAETAEGLPDGMKVDVKGNLYCTGPGGIWVFSVEGKVLEKIVAPEVPANCAFGGADGKTLFMTARMGLYRVRVETPGILP